MRTLVSVPVVILTFLFALHGSNPVVGPAAFSEPIHPVRQDASVFLEQWCVRCHGADDARAGLRLDEGARGPNPLASLIPGASSDALDEWDWIIEEVELGVMPPPGELAPSDEERSQFVAEVRRALQRATVKAKPDPLPHSPLRRLTRVEYEHALRDLFGIEFSASRLPEDAVAHGFDHVAQSQSLSEADFVRYLDTAEAAAERIVGVRRAPDRVVRIEAGELDVKHPGRSAAWLYSNGTAWGSVGLPRAGEYEVRASESTASSPRCHFTPVQSVS